MEQGADSGTNYPKKNFLKSNGNLPSILVMRLHPKSGIRSKAIIIRKTVADLAYSFLIDQKNFATALSRHSSAAY